MHVAELRNSTRFLEAAREASNYLLKDVVEEALKDGGYELPDGSFHKLEDDERKAMMDGGSEYFIR